MFLSFVHIVGKRRSLVVLSPDGPRQLGQFAAQVDEHRIVRMKRVDNTETERAARLLNREISMPSTLPTEIDGLNPKLGRIYIYPFKSLPGYEVPSSHFNQNGGLSDDRRYAFVRPNGGFFNAKTDVRIHQIRLQYLAESESFHFSLTNAPDCLEVQAKEGFQELERWIKKHFELTVVVEESIDQGFPDDLAAPGPTIISSETIRTIAAWYPGISEESMRKRLRTNLEVENVPAFWEDQLFGEKGNPELTFRIGKVRFQGTNPCQRCIVPSRDSDTGESSRYFSRIFRRKREESVPHWTPRTAFNHYFRAATNTRTLTEDPHSRITVGEAIQIETPTHQP